MANHLLVGIKSNSKRGLHHSKQAESKTKSGNSEGGQDIDNLHPSWIAKKSQRAGITDFSGKKVVFNEDEVGDKKVESSSLHPSWAAKKSNSVGIKAFSGQKIVF
jgi:hypothetical protein